MRYDPPADRPADTQYRDVLANVVRDGLWVPSRQGPRALTAMQQTMRFPLAHGFPMITERSVAGFWRKPINELCAFVNGAQTAAELEEFGCDWWGAWTTLEKTLPKGLPAGSLGPGSYGPAFHDFPTADGGGFNQFKHLVEQIGELPDVRTHFVSPWIPQYQQRGTGKTPRTTIAPCHGWVHVRVLDGRLHLHMMQRSGDLPVGVPSNMIQYAALLLMLEHLTGFEADTYYHTVSDAHVYEDQLDAVHEMLTRDPRPLPTLTLNEEGRAVRDIHDFRGGHFDLADYDPHPSMRGIPVAT